MNILNKWWQVERNSGKRKWFDGGGNHGRSLKTMGKGCYGVYPYG